MTQDNQERAAARGSQPEWIRPCNDNVRTRRRAEDISAQLAASLALAGPMVSAEFEFYTSVALTAAEGGGALHFRCSEQEILCLCGDGGAGILITPVAGRVLS